MTHPPSARQRKDACTRTMMFAHGREHAALPMALSDHMPPRCMTRTATDIPPLREATGGRTAEGRLRPSKHNDVCPRQGDAVDCPSIMTYSPTKDRLRPSKHTELYFFYLHHYVTLYSALSNSAFICFLSPSSAASLKIIRPIISAPRTITGFIDWLFTVLAIPTE